MTIHITPVSKYQVPPPFAVPGGTLPSARRTRCLASFCDDKRIRQGMRKAKPDF
jgi:hypothetical protein